MGSGILPDCVTNHGSIMGLDKDYHHGTPYEDRLCGVRCLAFLLNYNQTGNGFQRLKERQKHLSSQWKGGRQGTVNLSEMPLFEDMFDIDFDIWHHTLLSEWREAHRQDGPQFAWHSPQLCDECSCLLEKIPLWQLWAELRPTIQLETAPKKLRQCYRIWISRRILQNVSIHFQSFGRVWHRDSRGESTPPVAYHLWLWSYPGSNHRRTTYASLEMVTETRADLGQCGFQQPQIKKSQVLRECRCKRTDWGQNEIYWFHCWFGLPQCQTEMVICLERCGKANHYLQDQFGGKSGQWRLWCWCL